MNPLFDWHAFVRSTLAETNAQVPQSRRNRQAGTSAASAVSSRALVPPAVVPHRSGSGYWSGYLIHEGGRLFPIPQNVIARIRPLFEPLQFNKRWALPDTRAVVVLRVPTGAATGPLSLPSQLPFAYGWFVRFALSPTILVRIPQWIVQLLASQLRDDDEFGLADTESLTRMLPVDNRRFTRVVGAVFLQRRQLHDEQSSSRQRRKRTCCTAVHCDRQTTAQKQKVARTQQRATASATTCIVCLNERDDAVDRCGSNACAVAVCTGCHDAMRGLCPICDRGLQSAHYKCSACHKAHPLQDSGFACATCETGCVCRSCYVGYADCQECAAV